MKQVYIEFAMCVMHWREKAGLFCGFTLLPSGNVIDGSDEDVALAYNLHSDKKKSNEPSECLFKEMLSKVLVEQ